jgi:hypothetical protein
VKGNVMYLTRMVGVIATVFGVLFLLYIFVGCTLVPPELTGRAWWAAVLRTMVSQGAILGTALGAVFVLGGVCLLFFRAKPRPTLLAVIGMAALAALLVLGIAAS